MHTSCSNRNPCVTPFHASHMAAHKATGVEALRRVHLLWAPRLQFCGHGLRVVHAVHLCKQPLKRGGGDPMPQNAPGGCSRFVKTPVTCFLTASVLVAFEVDQNAGNTCLRRVQLAVADMAEEMHLNEPKICKSTIKSFLSGTKQQQTVNLQKSSQLPPSTRHL